jgi:hypothetical protein
MLVASQARWSRFHLVATGNTTKHFVGVVLVSYFGVPLVNEVNMLF